ncbi:hypothetical protein BN8_05011 [Fibrisoma limi BUZ 3]|uniref:Uncharacterized protein n=1 Tax=Fibrisoma limi BUZ 3 TaxID=1185876 RepID=I2GPA2_9BACT|nr:tetratricopeptide repeat protein [Fibrisoma limi]CCH55730.1 hypothetical protein BN8_05011 [Fibrisoma limi BUZ 3]
MSKSILLVVVLASALTAGLYSLPKVVVRDENKQLSATEGGGHTSQTSGARQADGTKSQSTDAATSNSTMNHEQSLSPEQQKQVAGLRAKFQVSETAAKQAAGEQLITFFREASRFDSAAYYAGLLASVQPDERNLLRAGDQYFEAYTYAVDEAKTASLGEKTREFYQKALEKNPNLLAAKANMAMTYVNTQTPMQGIMLLREVLQQDPTNELALFNLGLLSMRSGQYQKAIERFRQIIVVNPSSRKAQFYLGVSLAEAGQKAEALRVLGQVKEQEKDPQILAAIREYEERLQ